MRKSRYPSRFAVSAAIAVLAVLLPALLAPGALASIDVRSGSRAGTHTDVTVEVSGRTLKLRRVRRLNIDFPEGLSFNTRIGRSRCKPTAYLRRQCNGGLVVGRVSLSVTYRGRSHRFGGTLRLLKTGRGMIAAYGVAMRIPEQLGMDQQIMRLTDRVRLRASDNGINHSFGDVYRDLSTAGRRVESLKVRLKGRVGSGGKVKALITNPTRCDGATFRVAATTWAGYFTPIEKLRTYGGCNALPFDPRFEFAPGSGARRSATGFTTGFGVPFEDSTLQDAHIRQAVLRMPVGARWNQAVLNAAAVCSAVDATAARCPAASRLGTATAEVAGAALSGELHLIERSATVARFRAFLHSSLNARLTVSGSFYAEGAPGVERPVLMVDEAAQLPLSARFSFTQPLLVNSRTCGDNVATAEFTSYSGAVATRSAVFSVTGCPSAPLPPRITSGPADQAFLNRDDVAFEFDSTDLLPDDPTTFECSSNGGAFDACSSPVTAHELGEGTFAFAVRAVRDAKTSPATARSFTIDLTDPVVTIGLPAAGAYIGDSTPELLSSVVDTNPDVSTCSVDGSPFGPCLDELNPLADGTHAVTVRHTDKAGNIGAVSRSFTIDTVAPAVSVVAPANGGYTNDDTPTLTFSVTDANPQTSQCSVDGGGYAPCASGTNLAAQADGGHDVVVRHTDRAGNAATAVSTYTVDTVTPVVSVSQPAAGAYTSDSTPGVAYLVSDVNEGTTQCRVDGGAFGTCPSTTDTLAEGDHSLTVRHIDLAGNVGAATSGFTVDTTAPVVNLTSPAAGQLYSGDPVNLGLSLAEANPGSSECSVDYGPWSACPSTLDLVDGPHSVAVRHTDLAGNSVFTVRNFSVDGTAPTVQIPSPVDGQVYDGAPVPVSYATGDANLGTTRCSVDAGPFADCPTMLDLVDGSHTLTVRHTDAVGNVGSSSVTFTVDGTAPSVSISSPTAGLHNGDPIPASFSVTDANPGSSSCELDSVSVSCSAAIDAADGSHTFTVTHTDAAGNVGSSSVTFTIDGTAPSVSISSPTAGLHDGDPIPVALSVTDANPGTSECSVDGGAYGACPADLDLADGAHTLAARHTDAVGNVSATESVSFSVDGTAPTVTIDSPIDGNTYSGDPIPVTLTVTDANPGTSECSVDGGAYGACPADLDLADGSHTLDARHTDATGNVSAVASVTFTIDGTAPSVSISSPTAGLHDGAPIPVTLTVTDANPGTSECSVDGGAYAACPADLDLADGSHTLSVRHTDAAGNQGSASVAFTVDGTAPSVSIDAPADGSIVTSLLPESIVTFTSNDASTTTATCAVNGDPPVPCTSGDTLSVPFGAASIVVTVIDAVGNDASSTTAFTLEPAGP